MWFSSPKTIESELVNILVKVKRARGGVIEDCKNETIIVPKQPKPPKTVSRKCRCVL